MKKIIVDKSDKAPKKVRRRVKKGTKDEVISKRRGLDWNTNSDYSSSEDSLSFEDLSESSNVSDSDSPMGNNHKVNRVFAINEKKYQKISDDLQIEDIENIDNFKYSSETSNAPSKFRERSIDWQGEEYKADKDYGREYRTDSLDGFDKINEKDDSNKPIFFFPLFWAAALIIAGIFTAGGFATASYAKLQAAENRKIAMERLNSFEAAGSDEIAMQVVSIEEPVEYEEVIEDDFESKVLSLVLTSVEKDLKIKLVNNEDTLVKGIPWSVKITDEKENESVEQDDDLDGVIHLTDVNAGEYSVELIDSPELEGYELPREKQVVSVKAKIEYKVIQDIKEEIKTEKEVDAAKEDQEGKQEADVETGPIITDTVEWCESTKVENGEDYVEATPDLTKTASAKKENRFLMALKNLNDSVKTNSFGNGFSGFFATKMMQSANYNILTEEEPPADDEHTEHNFSAWVSDGKGSHLRRCLYPGCLEFEVGGCSFPDGAKKCPDCGYKNPDESTEHECSLKYEKVDEKEHKVTCTKNCDKGYPKNEAHTFNPDNVCTLCGYRKGDETVEPITEHVHQFTYKYSKDGKHKVTCTVEGCPGGFEKKEDCTSLTETCAKCGNTPGEHTHTFEYKTNNNGTHIASCACGMAIKDQACEYEGDICKFCGYKKTENGYADDAQLYDAEKNALYVKDGEEYRLAKYSDYKSGVYTTYYRKTEAFLYTGWQDIGGRRYYYRADHTYVTGDQIIGGVTYHFGSDGSLTTGSGTLGIDVSKYQPSINWSAVKASGVNYVIIRCGYRGSSTGVLIEDPYFKSHIKGAKAAGLKVGVYFFTTAISEAEAVEEASMCAYLCSGYGIDYPVFIDCESSSRPGYNGMSASQRTEIIKAFCNTIRSAGYTPGVYANKTWLSSYMNPGAFGGARIWLAQYNSAGPTYSGHYDMWQYTSKGSVDGISGYVDMNQSYLGY